MFKFKDLLVKILPLQLLLLLEEIIRLWIVINNKVMVIVILIIMEMVIVMVHLKWIVIRIVTNNSNRVI